MPVNLLLVCCLLTVSVVSYAQEALTDDQKKSISGLIDKYSAAREKRDTVLLKSILTNDIDQLVSNGEWRNGIGSAIQGMLSSSTNNPGTRTLTIDKIRRVGSATAIVDCKYNIQNANGSTRMMWSSFIVVQEREGWKISAIRNMLPSSN